MTRFKTTIAIAIGTLFAGAAFAQSNYSIEQRDRIEQARIERGIQTGQLTQREAAQLMHERAQVERLERSARADGVLTQHERARIDRAQDRLGRDIFRETHDRQVANQNWRTSDRFQGWDHRDRSGQRHFDNGVRPGQFNHRDADRGARHDWNVNGAATRTGSDARFGRSDLAPGRQPHLQQTEAQRTHVQQAQTQRSWNRPVQTGTTATAASPVAQQAQTQRSRNRSAQAGSTTTAAGPVVVARQGGYGGRHTR